MADAHGQPAVGGDDANSGTASTQSVTPAEAKGGMRLSMHNGVTVWCDCCSCEAEPYWAVMAEKPEADLGDQLGAIHSFPSRP